MPGHFECIGLESQEEVVQAIERAVKGHFETQRADGGTRFIWRDLEGARLVVNADSSGAVVCATPSFAGETSVEVEEEEIIRDSECDFCSRLSVNVLEDGDLVYPLAVQTEEMEPDRELVEGKRRLSITLFVEEAELWTDETAYDASFDSSQMRFASQSLIPVGTFPPNFPERRRFWQRSRHKPTAHALVTGVVNETRTRRNSATEREFAWANLESLGARYDIVAPLEAVGGGFSPGNVVQASCWVIARELD